MVQILTYLGNENELKGNNVVINSLHDAQSLDEFEINIINLQSNYIWRNVENTNRSINAIDDFRSLSVMISNCVKTKIVILLPQNVKFAYACKYNDRNWNYCELKNMIDIFKKDILKYLVEQAKVLDIVYENTNTSVGGINLSAAFYFNNVSENILTKSVKSNKTTTLEFYDVCFSTLMIEKYDDVVAFLKGIKYIKEKGKIPDWAKEVTMFDDEQQLEIINENKMLIQQLENKIDEAQSVLEKNQKYKSILYTTGEELVEGVFEILEEMIGCQLSDFKDNKKEDFRFTIDEKVFIGEIKGVTPNVKKANVSQVDVHVQEYLDEHEEHRENIVSLLIISHQRNKALSDREPIPDEQIRLAERNDSLIVETVMLLKLFEKYLLGEKSREECIDILSTKTGLLIV